MIADHLLIARRTGRIRKAFAGMDTESRIQSMIEIPGQTRALAWSIG